MLLEEAAAGEGNTHNPEPSPGTTTPTPATPAPGTGALQGHKASAGATHVPQEPGHESDPSCPPRGAGWTCRNSLFSA